MSGRWILLGTGLVAALWPVWNWYVRRLTDGSDEPWGVAALGPALWLIFRRWRPRPIATGRCLAAAGLLGLYAAGFGVLPPLVRAMIAVTAIVIIFPPPRGAAGAWCLLLLSLPVLATAQFYLGYPLRVVTATASAWILDGAGLGVTRTGLTLWWRGESVAVDAPCSGIHMLWGGLALTAGLCAWGQMRTRPTLAAMATAFVIVVAMNILRSSLLFFKEAHVVTLSDWTHPAIGCVCFAFATLAIFKLPELFSREPVV